MIKCSPTDGSHDREGLIEIGKDVVNVLDADRKPHIAVGDAGLRLLLWRKLRVRGAGRVDRERAYIADVGDVIEHLQAVDELASGIATALELEADQTAVTALEISIGTPLGLASHQAGEDCLGDFGVLGQVLRHGGRIAAMLAHAEHHGFETLDEHKRVERRHGRTDVSQQRDARLDDVSNRASGFTACVQTAPW